VPLVQVFMEIQGYQRTLATGEVKRLAEVQVADFSRLVLPILQDLLVAPAFSKADKELHLQAPFPLFMTQVALVAAVLPTLKAIVRYLREVEVVTVAVLHLLQKQEVGVALLMEELIK